MRQSCDDFADLAKDVNQFGQGAVQRGSTNLHGDMAQNTSRAVQNLADKIDAIAQVWGYVSFAHGPSWIPTNAHVIKAQERYVGVQGAADVLCGSRHNSDQGQALSRAAV